MLKIFRLNTTKVINFTPAGARRFNGEKDAFIAKNNLDAHYDYSESRDIAGHNGHCLVYNPNEGSKPWFTDFCTLLLLDILMFGWIQRYKLDTKTYKVEYTLKKLVLR